MKAWQGRHSLILLPFSSVFCALYDGLLCLVIAVGDMCICENMFDGIERHASLVARREAKNLFNLNMLIIVCAERYEVFAPSFLADASNG